MMSINDNLLNEAAGKEIVCHISDGEKEFKLTAKERFDVAISILNSKCQANGMDEYFKTNMNYALANIEILEKAINERMGDL